MFIYGRRGESSDDKRCYGGKCRCACETAAGADGSCNQIEHPGYNLYKYEAATITTVTPTTIANDEKSKVLICFIDIPSHGKQAKVTPRRIFPRF